MINRPKLHVRRAVLPRRFERVTHPALRRELKAFFRDRRAHGSSLGHAPDRQRLEGALVGALVGADPPGRAGAIEIRRSGRRGVLVQDGYRSNHGRESRVLRAPLGHWPGLPSVEGAVKAWRDVTQAVQRLVGVHQTQEAGGFIQTPVLHRGGGNALNHQAARGLGATDAA